MVIGWSLGSVRTGGGSGLPVSAAGGGQTVSSARTAIASNRVRPRPQIAAFLGVNGTVPRTILIRMLKNDPRINLIRTWLTRDLEWRIGNISVASADASF